ncbi:MAG: lysylphosphatidylglycerol synthase transmembrane domain-containing protein [Thermomicrobiales bacterium]
MSEPVSPSPEQSSSKRRLGALARIPTPLIFVGSIALAGLVLWWQGQIQELGRVLGDASWTPIVIAIPVYLFSLALLCYRWHVLVVMAHGSSDLPRASEAFLTSVVINYAAPVGLAVPSRAALTKRALGLDASATGTIAIWEIGLDVIVLGIGTLVWLILAPGSFTAVGDELGNSAGRYAIVGVAIVVMVLGGLVFALRKQTWRERIARMIKRIALAPKERPTVAALGFGVTAIYWILQGVVLALLLHALKVEITFTLVLGITSLPILVGMLSPIPGGAVVREALMYVVARLAGVSGAEVVAAALLYRFALFGAIPILYGITRLWISVRGDSSDPSPATPADPVTS